MRGNQDKNRAIGELADQNLPRLSEVAGPTVSGWVDYASWLSDDILLMVGWFGAQEDQPLEVSLALGDRFVPLEVRCMSYARANLAYTDPRNGSPADTDPRAGKILTARLPRSEHTRQPLGSVVVRSGAKTITLGPLELSHAVADLQVLLGAGLTPLAPGERSEVMEFLVSTLTEYGGATNSLLLSKNLFAIREALRERLPYSAIAQDQSQGLHADALFAVDERSFYIQGWMRDEEAEITQLTAVSPEGTRVELLESIFRYPRPDVNQFYGIITNDPLLEKMGFISYFETRAPSYLSTGWTIEMRNAVGKAVEAAAPAVVKDMLTVRNTILSDLAHERLPNESLRMNHVFPAVTRLQKRLMEMVEVEDIVQYGTAKDAPDVSIIIPLYQRIDFLEQQLAQFVHDQEIHQAELIYVLDSPELADSLKETAHQLFQLYRVPFRVAILKRNAGFSAVNNVGALLAHGRLLLLLNSDVLPDEPGWLGTLSEFYDSTPRIGALAPKLLYEDDSLQHAGLYFYRQRDTTWNNEHYFKGLHRHLPAANVARPVPALTGACMMIDSDLYKRLGGLQGIYVQGDFEDSDLCLRLIEAGYENWYVPHVELYHLEGQSYVSTLRQLNGRYNSWLHTRLWSERIEDVMTRYAPPTVDTVAVASDKRRRQVLS